MPADYRRDAATPRCASGLKKLVYDLPRTVQGRASNGIDLRYRVCVREHPYCCTMTPPHPKKARRSLEQRAWYRVRDLNAGDVHNGLKRVVYGVCEGDQPLSKGIETCTFVDYL